MKSNPEAEAPKPREYFLFGALRKHEAFEDFEERMVEAVRKTGLLQDAPPEEEPPSREPNF